MTSITNRQGVLDVIYLSSCAVNQDSPDTNRIERMDLDAVFQVAQHHMLASICATSLQHAGIHNERFAEAWATAVRKTALVDAEREKLFRSMNSAGIWHMPLKGCVLTNYYPAYGMREMSDNDILFDETRATEVREILEAQGFETVRFGHGVHDVYHKEPLYRFEMHRALFSTAASLAIREYYKRTTDLMIRNCDESFEFHLKDEDFYIYMIAHEYKHYVNAGTGLRSLLDTYVFLKSCEDSLDWDYIDNAVTQMEFADFEYHNRRLSQSLFSDNTLNQSDARMLSYIVKSGTFGSFDSLVDNRVKSKGRIGYLINRAFLPYENMADLYPALRRLPLLLPAFWVYRLGYAVVTKPKRVLHTFTGAFRKPNSRKEL